MSIEVAILFFRQDILPKIFLPSLSIVIGFIPFTLQILLVERPLVTSSHLTLTRTWDIKQLLVLHSTILAVFIKLCEFNILKFQSVERG